MDVKPAFLYGVLKEEIYIQLPEGYEKDGYIALLKKCIYGLKQSAREWYECLAKSLEKYSFTATYFDPCIFVHKTQSIYIAVYVDDILLFGHTSVTKKAKEYLKENLNCKDLGEAKYILGLEIIKTTEGYELTQRGYIGRILEKFGMHDAKTVGTPLDPNKKLKKGDTET
jgi:hypothetical protein